MLTAHHMPRARLAALAGAALAISASAGPVHAKDFVHDCLAAPGTEETATVVFHPKLFGVDGHEGDGDVGTDDFEHRFAYTITVTDFDPKKPGWTGPTRCSLSGSWRHDWDMPNIRYEFMEQQPGAIIYIQNVPRRAKLSLIFHASELDSGEDDILDFDPAPKTNGDLELSVFVSQMQAQTMVGARTGQNDVTLNKAKRVIGDGKIGIGHDHVRAFIEFVTNVHADTKWLSDPVTGKNMGVKIPGKPPKLIQVPVTAEPLCRDYAIKAVEMNVEAQKLGCGFNPPVWSNDHQMHYDWCMHGKNSAYAGGENVKRSAALSQCAAQKSTQPKADLALCAIYATEASTAAIRAQKLGCGFGGPRWQADYSGHFGWCMAGANPAVMLAESLARATQLAGCSP